MAADALLGLSPLLLLLCLYGGLSVAARVYRSWQRAFARYAAEMNTCGLTGHAIARRLLDDLGLSQVAVVRSTKLNCYRPWKRQVCLRAAAFDGASLPALVVAAHEVGHAQQFASDYIAARLWRILWPLFALLAAGGMVLLVGELTVPSSPDFVLLNLLPAFVVAQVLMLDSLLLEHDASRRARKLVQQAALITVSEQRGFNLMLNNAFRMHAGRVGCFVSLILLLPLLNGNLLDSFFGNTIVGDAPAIETAVVNVPEVANPESSREVLTVDLDVVTPMVFATSVAAVLALFPILWRIRARRAVNRCNAGLAFQKQGAFDEALAEYNAALRLDRKQVSAYLGRGTTLMQMGQLDKALVDLEAATRLAPNVAGLLTARGTIQLGRGDYDRALADFNEALYLVPESTQALVGRAHLWLLRRDLERAAADFERALAGNPKDPSALRGRCQLRLAKGDVGLATADIQQAFTFDGSNADSYALRAQILLVSKEYEGAVTDLDEACRLAPQRADLFRDRGLAWFLKGDFDRAIADADHAIRLNPNDAVAFNNRGAALLKSGRYARAVSDLRQAIGLNADFPNPYKHLAWIQATCPESQFLDGAQAVVNATRALELAEWKPIEWLAILAAAHAENGGFEQAVKWQTKCNEDSPAETKRELQGRLELYAAHQPFRDQPVTRLPISTTPSPLAACDGSQADVSYVESV